MPAIPLSPTGTISKRLAEPQDEPFLRLLFARTDSMLTALPDALRSSLLDMQYSGRALSYAAEFPAAEDWLLLDATGTPVGRHLLERTGKDIRTIDIAVLPEHQGRGYATWALQKVQQEAGRCGGICRLRVVKTNPALRLYQRLGYTATAEDELSWELRWIPEAATV